MSGLSTPGSKRLKASELREWVESCKHCEAGWVHVAFGFEDSKWSVYKWPCRCRGGTYEWYQLDNTDFYRNREPDYYATPAELPGYVFIHPAHKHGFGKVLKRINQIKARMQAEASDAPPPF